MVKLDSELKIALSYLDGFTEVLVSPASEVAVGTKGLLQIHHLSMQEELAWRKV